MIGELAKADRFDAVLLSTWADLNFLVWQDKAGQNIRNLKHVFRATLSNVETKY